MSDHSRREDETRQFTTEELQAAATPQGDFLEETIAGPTPGTGQGMPPSGGRHAAAPPQYTRETIQAAATPQGTYVQEQIQTAPEPKETKWYQTFWAGLILGAAVVGLIMGFVLGSTDKKDRTAEAEGDTAIAELEAQMEEQADTIKELESNLKEAEEAQKNAEAADKADGDALTSAQNDVKQAEADKAAAQQELDSVRNQLTEAQGALNDAKQEAADWQNVARTLTDQLKNLGETPSADLP